MTFLVRLASTVGGVLIEYHEVYIADTAQWPLVFLGLWLIGVPPAQYLDTLRRAAAGVAAVNAGDPPGPPVSGPPPQEKPGSTDPGV